MIVENAVTCKKCDDFIVSKHRHDFVTCSCGTISADGGQVFRRRVGDLEQYLDHSWEIPDEVYNDCANVVQKAMDTGRNKFGIANAVLRKLRESQHIRATGERWIYADAPVLEELWVVEPDGNFAKYKKIAE
jgi:hypothetical protein